MSQRFFSFTLCRAVSVNFASNLSGDVTQVIFYDRAGRDDDPGDDIEMTPPSTSAGYAVYGSTRVNKLIAAQVVDLAAHRDERDRAGHEERGQVWRAARRDARGGAR
jgi:hypothetical protein